MVVIYMHDVKVKQKEEKMLHDHALEDRQDRQDFQEQLHTEMAANETLEHNPIRLRTNIAMIENAENIRLRSTGNWNENRGRDSGYNSTKTTLDHQMRQVKDR